MIIAGAEEPDQSDDDQINGDDVIEEPGHDENEYPGDQRYQWSKTQVDSHKRHPFVGCSVPRGDEYACAAVNRRSAATP